VWGNTFFAGNLDERIVPTFAGIFDFADPVVARIGLTAGPLLTPAGSDAIQAPTPHGDGRPHENYV
jgi:hypothetical protein